MAEWIAVTERLPGWRDGKLFNVYSPERGVLPARLVYTDRNHWNYLAGKDVDNGAWSDVTHWAHLPQPPHRVTARGGD